MYGLIGRIDAVPGKRDALMDILLEGTAGMPGCLLYVVSRDVDAPDALWVTEIWARKEDHQASLTLPAVRDAIGALTNRVAEGFGSQRVGCSGQP